MEQEQRAFGTRLAVPLRIVDSHAKFLWREPEEQSDSPDLQTWLCLHRLDFHTARAAVLSGSNL